MTTETQETPLDIDSMLEDTGPNPEPDFDFSDIPIEESPPVVTPKASRVKREKSTKTAASKPRTAPPYRAGQFVQPLTQMYAFIGMAVLPFDPTCGTAVMQSGEECAKSLDELAKSNIAVRRALYALTATSAWGAVIAAHVPILVAVGSHHVPAVRDSLERMGEGMVNSDDDNG